VLFISDFANRMATTALFRPEYNVWDGVHLYRISPLLTCAQELVEAGSFGPNLPAPDAGKGEGET
jgi:hypothetical protein